MAKKEEHKEQETEPEVEEESEETEDFQDNEYNKEMMILDEATNKLIDKLGTIDVEDKKNWDDLKELTKILKNITCAKKNLLKADLLSIELNDCLYDDLEEDESKDEAPVEFEDEEIEEVEEPENKKGSKKHK